MGDKTLLFMFGIFSGIIVFILVKFSPVDEYEERFENIESRLVDQTQFNNTIHTLCVDADIKSVICSQAKAKPETNKGN